MSEAAPQPDQPGLDLLRAQEELLITARRQAAVEPPGHPGRDAVGVALSGGGIRSATFCLGLFQALARQRLVRRVDLLSTVSGGGYFGGFLGRLFTRADPPPAPAAATPRPPASDPPRYSLLSRRGQSSCDGLHAKTEASHATLGVERVETLLKDNSATPLQWLRESGNYLTPGGSRDSALAAAVFTRNWIALLVVMLVSTMTMFLLGNFARSLLNSWEGFHRYELWLQSFAGEHFWWTPWWFVPWLVVGLVVVPVGWAFWLTQAGDARQFACVGGANLLVIGFGVAGWRLLPDSSFCWGAVAIGTESFLALAWVFALGIIRCHSSDAARGLLPSARLRVSTYVTCLLPAIWRELARAQQQGRGARAGLWAAAVLLLAAGFHHLALRAAAEGPDARRPKDGAPPKRWGAWLGCWDRSGFMQHWPGMISWLLVVCVGPLFLTVWPGWRELDPRYGRLLDVWEVLAVMAVPYFLAFQVLRADEKTRRDGADSKRLALTSWLRSKLSDYLCRGLLVYAVIQVLVIVNTCGQSLYATLSYAGGFQAALGAMTGLLGLAGLAPLVRSVAIRSLGVKAGLRAPLTILALVGALVLTLLLALSLACVSHGIAWRWGCPVLAPEGPLGLRARIEQEWTSGPVPAITLSEEGRAEAPQPNVRPSPPTNSAGRPGAAGPERARRAIDRASITNSAGAKIYHYYNVRPTVSLSKGGFIRIRPFEGGSHSLTPQKRMFILDLGFSLAIALALTLFFGQTISFLNLSSFHSFYTSRLIRAYLGASNPNRPGRPDSSIDDVEPDDDIAWDDYHPHTKGGPLHLVNATVNCTVTAETNKQSTTAKGINLCMGPAGLSFGSRHAIRSAPTEPGRKMLPGCKYRLAEAVGTASGAREIQFTPKTVEALSLGDWVGISGAAFTTGLGNVGGGGGTAVGTSLLCGLFNVRLGYWWKNDFSGSTAGSPDRYLPLQTYLVNELTGSFHLDKRDRWYLSDGGHFENTAAYELVRRQAAFIVVADCGADRNGDFDDIANLVRRARVDFGTEITFFGDEELRRRVHHDLLAPCVGWRLESLGQARPAEPGDLKAARPDEPAPVAGRIGTLTDLRPFTPVSDDRRRVRAHATLAWANYRDGKRSLMLFVKPGITGDLPADLINYQQANESFPQQSTLDQFFDEAEWESYRKLGSFISDRLFAPPAGSTEKWWPARMSVPCA